MKIKNPILIGFIWSLFASFSMLVVLVLLVHFTSLPESSLPTITLAIHIVSILLGSLRAGIRSTQKGWYAGGFTGLLYMLFILIFGSIVFSGLSLGVDALIQTALGIALGVVGGIIGVNFSNS